MPEQQPIKSVKELIDLAQANPGKFPYGSFGNVTTSHLYGELLKKKAGIDMTHVPYHGAAPLFNDLLGNTVTATFLDPTTAGPQIKAGKIRALAIGGEKRRTHMPDVRLSQNSASPASRPKAASASSCLPERPRPSCKSFPPNSPASSPHRKASPGSKP